MPTTDLSADVLPSKTADIQYKIAATREERASAFRLVYKSYLEARLGGANPYGMRVTPYHLLPGTMIFIATLRGETILTVTLIADGPLGLPIESVYAEEVAARRQQGLLAGEVSCLADRRSWFRGFLLPFIGLNRLMAQYARHQGLDELLVAVHPRHARFYRRYMGFRLIGEEKAYPSVHNKPAVPLCLNFAQVDRHRPRSYDTFFGAPIPPARLEPRPMSPADHEYFGKMVDPGFHIAPVLCIDELFGESTPTRARTIS